MMAEATMTAVVDVDQWRRWRTSGDGRKRWQAWVCERPILADWELDDLTSPTASARTDAMQAALVDLAQRGEGQAVATLLVQLRPGLARLVRWARLNGLRSSAEATDEVRAVFFETIYRHSLQRRPAKIAANLILDTRQRLTRSTVRLRKADQLAVLPGRSANLFTSGFELGADAGFLSEEAGFGLGVQWDPDPLSALAVSEALRAAVERLPGSENSRRLTATLAFRAWVLEEPRAVIAADLGLPVTMVAKRLHRLRLLVRREDLVA